jgi:hypothetical protein
MAAQTAHAAYTPPATSGDSSASALAGRELRPDAEHGIRRSVLVAVREHASAASVASGGPLRATAYTAALALATLASGVGGALVLTRLVS